MHGSPVLIARSISLRTFWVSLLLSTFLATSAYCQDSCTVILKNGNKVEASSYRIEGSRIFLKYPVGEASFELSQVETVSGGGGTEFFRDKGTARPSKEAAASEKPVQPEPPDASLPAAKETSPGNASCKDQPFASQSGQEMTAEENPEDHAQKEQKFGEFFDRYWQGDKKQQAEMSKEMDKVFSDYLGTGTSEQPQGP